MGTEAANGPDKSCYCTTWSMFFKEIKDQEKLLQCLIPGLIPGPSG
jgi:hypothetical protein